MDSINLPEIFYDTYYDCEVEIKGFYANSDYVKANFESGLFQWNIESIAQTSLLLAKNPLIV
ncbi:hypothetical protein BA1DRAFT_00854 [Photorhabdus aegyptia]|nr:hypothetical protein BA1DRAFT_00854 [Photorhabdus aegyptia]